MVLVGGGEDVARPARRQEARLHGREGREKAEKHFLFATPTCLLRKLGFFRDRFVVAAWFRRVAVSAMWLATATPSAAPGMNDQVAVVPA